MKPEAPVTSALATGMAPHGFTVLIDLLVGALRSPVGTSGKVAVPIGRQFDGIDKCQRRCPAEQRARLGAVEMQEARFRETSGSKGDFRSDPGHRELFDEIS